MENVKILDYSANSVAVIGETFAIKESLKKLGGKFNARLKCGAGWIFSAKKRTEIENLLSGKVSPESGKKVPARENLLEDYMREVEKAWKEKDMRDYFRKNFSSAVRLSNGEIVAFEKPQIEKDFCFGYSTIGQGPEYDEARESMGSFGEESFLRKNLEKFDPDIKVLESLRDEYDRDVIVCIKRESYYDREKINVWKYEFIRPADFDTEREHYEGSGIDFKKVCEEDRLLILSAMREEREKFEKRLKTYLKRYGTSKLHKWTYWIDE